MTDPTKSFYFPVNNRNILCEVYPPHHRTILKKITFSITHEHSIKIKAPKNTPTTVLVEILQKHIQWITQQLEQKPFPFTYTQGEAHFYLGNTYPIKIIESSHQKQYVELQNNILHLSLHYYTPQKVYALLDSWYRFQALTIFSERILFWQKNVPWINWIHHPPLLRIKKMNSRWGSYTNRHPGVVSLNQHLIKASINCIDYVILHELCHAAEPNHSKKFYHLLARIMPNWKTYQLELQEKSILFLYNAPPNTEN